MDCCREVVETPSDGLNRRYRSTRYRLTQLHGGLPRGKRGLPSLARLGIIRSGGITSPCEAEARTVQANHRRLVRIRLGAVFCAIQAYKDCAGEKCKYRRVKLMDAGGSSYGTCADHIRRPSQTASASPLE